MADTIIKKDQLQAEVERFLDIQPTFLRHVNLKYSPSIKRAGDTATVQTFPDISLSSGTAGADIADQDFTISGTNIVADQVDQARISITDFDEAVSNLDLHSQIAGRIAYEVNDSMEKYYVGLHVNALAANELDDGDLATATNGGAGNAAIISKTNVYEAFSILNQKLDENNATGRRYAFVSPAIKAILIQAGFGNGSDTGYGDGKEGMVAEVAGLEIYVTNNAPTGFMIAMDSEAVHGVAKYAKVDVREATTGFYDNVIVESIYGGKVLPNGAKRIATLSVTN